MLPRSPTSTHPVGKHTWRCNGTNDFALINVPLCLAADSIQSNRLRENPFGTVTCYNGMKKRKKKKLLAYSMNRKSNFKLVEWTNWMWIWITNRNERERQREYVLLSVFLENIMEWGDIFIFFSFCCQKLISQITSGR